MGAHMGWKRERIAIAGGTEEFQATTGVPHHHLAHDFFPKDKTLPKSLNSARVL